MSRPGYEYYSTIEEAVKKAFPTLEAEIVEKAFYYAYDAHDGQKRKSGEDYIIHPVAVAKILIEFGMDYQSVVSALLHDVVEDTPVTAMDVK